MTAILATLSQYLSYAILLALLLHHVVRARRTVKFSDARDTFFWWLLALLIVTITGIYTYEILGGTLAQAFITYRTVLVFYLCVASLIYLHRHKIEGQGRIGWFPLVALYRAKWGLKLMDKLGHPPSKTTETRGEIMIWTSVVLVLAAIFLRLVLIANRWIGNEFINGLHPIFSGVLIAGMALFLVALLFRPIRLAAHIGIYVGFAGMAFITFFLVYEFYKLFTQPELASGVALVVPGVPIPGSPIFVPFWYGMLALFTVVVIHEFSHGVVARAHNIKVKNSGLVMFGPIPGAFVEPEEEEMKKRPHRVQHAIFSAGPFSNILLSILAILLIQFAFEPALMSQTNLDGIVVSSLEANCPGEKAGVQTGTIYTTFNGDVMGGLDDFMSGVEVLSPGDSFTLGNAEIEHTVTTVPHPDNESRAFVGVSGLSPVYSASGNPAIYTLLYVINKFLFWIFLLSSGIGLINLLPVGPVDGGRMFHLASQDLFGKKRGINIWTKLSLLLLAVLVALILTSLFKGIFSPAQAAVSIICP